VCQSDTLEKKREDMANTTTIGGRNGIESQPHREPAPRESDPAEGGLYRYLVLGLLRDGAARHGYGIMKEYQQRSGIQMCTGRFYNKLQRLAADGLVTTAANPPGADPRRTPYRITTAGAACFDAWLQDSATPETQRDDDLSARALLLAAAEPEVVSATLNRWRSDIWMRGASVEEAHKRALATQRMSSTCAFDPLPLLLARRLKHTAVDIEFIDEFRRTYARWTRGRANARASRGGRSGGGPGTPPIRA